LNEPYKAEPLCPLCVCVCVCVRERERCARARSFLLFWAWEGEIVWGVEDQFCVVLRGSGFDNCGLDLYGVLLAAFGLWKEVLEHTTLNVWTAVVFHLDV
jgi:hypothetical protein